MSTLVRSQLLASLRAGVLELDAKIEDAERDISECTFATRQSVRLDRYARLTDLAHERDALIARIEEAEEADDLMWDLKCAFSDATDCDGVSEDALRAALERHGLEVRRKPNPNSPRERIAKILPHGPESV